MRIGTLSIGSNLFLSPLAGYTNLPFRLTVRELGGLGLATTDLVNARSLVEQRPKALKLIETGPGDQPLAVQLFGAVPAEMRDAAIILEQRGVDSIDINMGCPVRKVCKVGGGSAMMTSLKETARLAKGMVDAVQIPVTAKMRLGWDDQNLTAPDLTKALADVGIAAVTIHGRTREQGFSGTVNLEGIRQVVSAVPGLPVIGNGDVTSAEAARTMMETTGCAGVSIGRGAFYNPWIFAHTQTYLETGQVPPEPTFDERLQVMRQHLERMVEIFGQDVGCRMFRKVAPWYARRFGPAKPFNRRVATLSSLLEFDEIVESYSQWREQFLDEQGLLKTPFQPPRLDARDSGGEESRSIPVPRGPVEIW